MPMHNGPAVLHRHTLPSGAWHYDLMLAPHAGPFEDDDRVLSTFRLAVEPWSRAPFDAELINMHRAAYLHLTSRDLGERGRVQLVARGHATWCLDDRAGRSTITATLGQQTLDLSIARVNDNRWRFEPR